MAIDSDLQGADNRLAVKFYKRPVNMVAASAEAGRPIYEERVYIKIMVPGDQLTEIDRPIYNEDKQRFSRQWYSFMNSQDGQENFSGTPLSAWPQLSTSQVEELKGLKFHTVEQIADSSDQQLQRIGMSGGMSPFSLREKAKSFLNLAKDSAEVAKREEELTKLREENAKIKAETDAKLAQMQEQMANILAAVGEKKPRGRKAKVVEE